MIIVICYCSRVLRKTRWLALAIAACALAGSATAGTTTRIQVTAAESVWGGVAAELGGSYVTVTSIVANPAADPHDYEPTAIDARALAGADLAITNGAGYDPWATKLLDANPVKHRLTVEAASVVGVSTGSNPHLWYSPASVDRVASAITAALIDLDPTHRAAYAQQGRSFRSRSLHDYSATLASIRTTYAGARIGASESIVAPLAAALKLRVVTPAGLLRAVSEGADPSAKDVASAERQITEHQISVWIENIQNATPDVERLTTLARKSGIPVVSVTETPSPAGITFQAWQTAQLVALKTALARGNA
ncbi:MAG: ABC transporter substrate-binding protein [Actinobacteria bacterium]|nr:ABC transporter substrate-binding protein [Actinomycetota bacterium]